MSTPAALRDAREAFPPRPAPFPAPAPEPPRRRPTPAVWLAAIFALAAAYYATRGALHATPAVFTDELLHGGLARAFADGTPFELRGVLEFFPAFLPALVAAPAWLVADTETAYAVAKAWNAVVMSAACIPAYALARQVVRPAYALFAAGAAVAAPGMLYSAYLLSEPLAYPVFLLAVGVYVRALARPSAGWWIAAAGISVLAVGTRAQFVVLPLVFGVVLALRPGRHRRFALPALAGLAAVGALAAIGSGAAGMYAGFLGLEVDARAATGWALATAALLPFAAGLAVVPGALIALAGATARPRTAAEGAFAPLTAGIAFAFLVLVGVVAAGDSARPLERYAIYLVPLLVVGFLLYVERGAPRRRVYAGLALGLAALGWLVPFGTLADNRFSFDSPVLSAYGALAHALGHANAATVFGVASLAVGVALAFRPLRARTVPVVAGASVALMLAVGLAALAADRAMTERARAAWAPANPNWLDDAGFGRADLLGLPGGAAFFAWTFEAWNRDAGRPLWLAAEPPRTDPWPSGRAEIADDGTLLVDGRAAGAGLLVVNDHGSRIELEGETLARPRAGLRLVRVPDAPRVAALAVGLHHDGWAGGAFRYRTWGPAGAGVYRAVVSLPAGLAARPVVFEVEDGPRRVVRLEGGGSVAVDLPAESRAQALRISSDRAELLDGAGANPRLVSFRVERLEYRPGAAPAARALAF